MPIICGLRNPGAQYLGTRHNLGYEVVAEFARRHQARFKRGPLRVRAEIARMPIGDVTLLAPTTFMNESGRAVTAALRYFKIAPADLLIVHDDIDLDFGRLRLQVGGGSGGNNGIKSVEAHLGHRDFSRLKVGVGRPRGSREAAGHVLSQFSRKEREEADLLVADAADVVEKWLDDRPRAQELAAHRRP